VLTVLGLEERDMITAGGGALLYAEDKRRAAALKNTGALPPEYGLPDMNAAMAAVQMRECAKNIEKRREIAQIYTQAAMRGRHKRFVEPENFIYNHYAFAIVLETGMKDVRQYAAKHGVAVESAFENTLALSGLVKPEQCPHAAGLALRTALFPLYPRLGRSNAETVAKVITTLP
jgi:dTDP-4-amino-4,6-dideoxygalactose transaminase